MAPAMVMNSVMVTATKRQQVVEGGVRSVPLGEVVIRKRPEVIALAIDARRQHHPDETPFRYAPFAGLEDDHRYDPATAAEQLHDYNLHDLAI